MTTFQLSGLRFEADPLCWQFPGGESWRLRKSQTNMSHQMNIPSRFTTGLLIHGGSLGRGEELKMGPSGYMDVIMRLESVLIDARPLACFGDGTIILNCSK